MSKKLLADLWRCSECGHFHMTTLAGERFHRDGENIFCNFCEREEVMNTYGTIDLTLLNSGEELMQYYDTLEVRPEASFREEYIQAVRVGVDAGIFDMSYMDWLEYHDIRNFPIDRIRRDLGFDANEE